MRITADMIHVGDVYESAGRLVCIDWIRDGKVGVSKYASGICGPSYIGNFDSRLVLQMSRVLRDINMAHRKWMLKCDAKEITMKDGEV